LLGVLLISVLINPVLPALSLPSAALLPHAVHLAPPQAQPIVPASPRTLRHARLRLEMERRRARPRPQPPRAVPTPGGPPLAAAFFVNWDDSSLNSLKENLGSLDMVIAEWLHLQSADGTLSEDSPRRQAQATEYIRQRRPDLHVMPLVNNFNGRDWEGEKLASMLRDPSARARTVSQCLAYVQRNHFFGISLDFENLPAGAHEAFLRLVEETALSFHAAGLAVSVNVAPDDDRLDYARLSRAADYVILMAYDQHWAGGSPGPIAAIDWFTAVLARRQADVPANRTIVAVGNYGYDWGAKGRPAEERTFEEAVLTAKESDATIGFDPTALEPGFRYEGENGITHQVWMLDAASAFNQVRIATTHGAGGVALWRLGSEDPSIWTFFGRGTPLDAATAQQLGTIRYGYDLDYEGEGEIIGITSQPSPGRRTLSFDQVRQAIVGERFDVLPTPYVLTRYGKRDHQLVLTFDDGPDPDYTPAILDILRAERVPGLFFIIGVNGETYPGLLKRIVGEGHEIGNHTFTHPNIANIPVTQLRFELSATQRLLEGVLGLQSHLFRPPYAEDAEPETPDQVAPLEFVNERGYVTVGMRIDPGDWQRPGVEAIVRRTVEQAASGEGNVILLHDGGGDRNETVSALPAIIGQLRARGFRFVSLSELLGRSRADLMPPLSSRERWQSWGDALAFGALNIGIVTLRWLFLTGIVLGVFRLLFVGSLAIAERWFGRRRTYSADFQPSVAVVVPAFNEEKVIVQTVTSLLASDHPTHFEIVVVDDGSTDRTVERVREAFAAEPRVQLLTKGNGGKAVALNYGVAHTTADIVVALDADTVFARDTISKLVRHFCDPAIGAVAGNARVGNRVNLLTRWQALEYITSQNLDRRAFDLLNCITVVPGAVGAWRRELIRRVGGFSPLTLAEDADLTMAILRMGYRVAYEEDAMALTEAPDTVKGFVKQRYRWMYGTFQAAWKHRGALFRWRDGALGLVALPNLFVFQIVFPIVSPVMDLVMAASLVATALDRWQHPTGFNSDTLRSVLFYYALFLAVDLGAALIAFALERKESVRLLVLLVWQRFFYRQLMYYVAIRALLASVRGGEVGWGKVERRGTITG
jgi:cellulose synthase/poly-beta-1,6-N-acetylglucosamine synthase-like glycosyltransferase/spore germination protein YaaH/peptidoglycan/xylan/chitin deacetylase (PgdA/CDA1 family)